MSLFDLCYVFATHFTKGPVMTKRNQCFLLLFALASLLGLVGFFIPPIKNRIQYHLMNKRTVQDIIEQFGPQAKSRLSPYFTKNQLPFPPQKITFLAFKAERILEVWVHIDQNWQFLKSYPILGASGTLGPKLREGDRQVPEGIYRLSGLNPNSAFHLSMKVNYPNEFDLKQAALDGRDEPGTNIFIHGKTASVGCLAMGDPAIEELFILTAETGFENVQVIIAPHDPRKAPLQPHHQAPNWTPTLYKNITDAMQPFQIKPSP